MTSYTGIDYSITSPSICTISDDGTILIRGITTKKKYIKDFSINNINIEIVPYPDHDNPYERYKRLSQTLLKDFPLGEHIAFEGYAYSRSGKVFNIAEATYECKRHIYTTLNIIPHEISPTLVKKIATGKGNANKEQMANAFMDTFGFHIHESIGCKIGDSPASDCIDALFVAIALKIELEELSSEEALTLFRR